LARVPIPKGGGKKGFKGEKKGGGGRRSAFACCPARAGKVKGREKGKGLSREKKGRRGRHDGGEASILQRVIRKRKKREETAKEKGEAT